MREAWSAACAAPDMLEACNPQTSLVLLGATLLKGASIPVSFHDQNVKQQCEGSSRITRVGSVLDEQDDEQ